MRVDDGGDGAELEEEGGLSEVRRWPMSVIEGGRGGGGLAVGGEGRQRVGPEGWPAPEKDEEAVGNGEAVWIGHRGDGHMTPNGGGRALHHRATLNLILQRIACPLLIRSPAAYRLLD
jgi:hypothetical protein